MDFLIEEFYEEMNKEEIAPFGILDTSNHIHTLGTDSKIIGRIFEMFAQPVLERIAQKHGLMFDTPTSQTVYPDFIMMESPESKNKIAIDVKSTYVDDEQSTIKFTLGSYGSYMRNNTKNIEYRYTDYSKHYVVGFIYKRNDKAQESKVFAYDNRNRIQLPFTGVDFFVQEKYKIAGDKPGSGNTENIGSFSTKNITDLKNGNGPFSFLGVDVFDLYWKYYPKYRSTDKPYTSLDGFLNWFLTQEPARVKLLHEYDYEKMKQQVLAYIRRRATQR